MSTIINVRFNNIKYIVMSNSERLSLVANAKSKKLISETSMNDKLETIQTWLIYGSISQVVKVTVSLL